MRIQPIESLVFNSNNLPDKRKKTNTIPIKDSVEDGVKHPRSTGGIDIYV